MPKEVETFKEYKAKNKLKGVMVKSSSLEKMWDELQEKLAEEKLKTTAAQDWCFKIYDDDEWDSDINNFNRYVEGLRGIKSTGLVFGGVTF